MLPEDTYECVSLSAMATVAPVNAWQSSAARHVLLVQRQ
jgi:hypothetical protein